MLKCVLFPSFSQSDSSSPICLFARMEHAISITFELMHRMPLVEWTFWKLFEVICFLWGNKTKIFYPIYQLLFYDLRIWKYWWSYPVFVLVVQFLAPATQFAENLWCPWTISCGQFLPSSNHLIAKMASLFVFLLS